MAVLNLERAKELLSMTTTEDHLLLHAMNVSVAMGGMARHFGADENHWMAIGYLHDYDYEQYPEEHLQHTEAPLLEAGLEPWEVRAILAHGYEILNDVQPKTDLEKALFTVDELTGIIQAAARMRPAGITDMEIASFMKKFKDKKFAAKCDRELIKKGCAMLNMEVRDVAAVCIEAMKPFAAELQIGPK
jgi:predicted hydrolase (HD superfamily)